MLNASAGQHTRLTVSVFPSVRFIDAGLHRAAVPEPAWLLGEVLAAQARAVVCSVAGLHRAAIPEPARCLGEDFVSEKYI